MRFASRIAFELTMFGNWRNRGYRKPPPFKIDHIRPRESGAFSCTEES